jgi:hypothetical protein
MPAHLCQLKSFSRVGDIGRSDMYSPMLNEPTMANASSQWKKMASGV